MDRKRVKIGEDNRRGKKIWLKIDCKEKEGRNR
jgi:hypothetical protein